MKRQSSYGALSYLKLLPESLESPESAPMYLQLIFT